MDSVLQLSEPQGLARTQLYSEDSVLQNDSDSRVNDWVLVTGSGTLTTFCCVLLV